MPINHALVVDDSRAARVALKKLLEEQGLEVSVSSSGEEALDFLKKNQPDVVFMDHTMPGMDGLEAVSAIKANPKTATIPVMMYTTREGEVYVGQARALGAVGVMPKNVQPHQLFEMLAELGLVTDRRAAVAEVETGLEIGDSGAEGEAELEQQAIGISVQNLVGRILEDQHMTLRSDILRSQRTFAKEVAKEIVLEQARAEERLQDEAERVEPREFQGQGYRSLTLVVTVVAVVALFFAYQFKVQRDDALSAMKVLEAQHTDFVETDVAEMEDALQRMGDSDRTTRQEAILALEWAINGGNTTWYDEQALSPALADKTEQLVNYLENLGFVGEVEMTSHLGRFCLNVDAAGTYTLAPDELPMLQCDYIGHPQDESSRVTDRLSVPFSRLYTSQLNADTQIVLVALDGSESSEIVAYPPSTATAGEWNTIAEINNRVEIRISEASAQL